MKLLLVYLYFHDASNSGSSGLKPCSINFLDFSKSSFLFSFLIVNPEDITNFVPLGISTFAYKPSPAPGILE